MRTKILILIDWFFPGYKAGGPTTSNVNIVEHLKEIFDFHIITTDTDYHESAPYKNIVPNKWLRQNNYSVYYFRREDLTFSSLKKAIKASGCDIWYINGIYSKYFSIYPLILAKSFKPQKVIVSARGMLSPHALAIKSVYKRCYLFIAKHIGLFNNVIFHATNEDEAKFIKIALGNKIKTSSIPNLPRKITVNISVTEKKDTIIKLVSFARISQEKNTLFAIQCLKLCKEKVIYHIYGQINSTEYWDECKRTIKELPDNVSVEYKGTVSPNEMPEIYKDYHFLYLPSTGENFGHAILESFMNSTPVIISDRTPWTDLSEKHIGWDLPLDSKELFASTIDKCAKLTSDEYSNLSHNAYEFAKTICNNPAVKQEYIDLFSL